MWRAAVPAVGALVVLLAPVEMEGHARTALAIAVAMILAWLVEFLHPGMVGFIGSFLFVATGGVEFEHAFAGFATTTPWFFYGALLMFSAAQRGGLIGALRRASPAFLTRSTTAASVVLTAIAYLLAFVVPSSLAKAVMLALLAGAWSTSIAPWLAAAYGAAAFGHAEMPGGALAIVGFDVALGAALVAASLMLSRWAAADEPAETRTEGSAHIDCKVAAVIGIAVALWLTSSLHRATPELVGLAAGLVCWLPGIAPVDTRRGVAPRLDERSTARSGQADPLALIFVGTALSIPAVLIETGAADVLMRLWLTANQSAAMLPHTLVAYWTTTVYRLFSPEAAQSALPALDGIATPLGLASTWAYASSTFLSLHQSPALALAMSVGGCRARYVLMTGVIVLVAGSVVVLMF